MVLIEKISISDSGKTTDAEKKCTKGLVLSVSSTRTAPTFHDTGLPEKDGPVD